MSSPVSRRRFLQTAAASASVAGLGELAFLSGLPPVSAADVQAVKARAAVQADIEPLVRLIEDTPREKLLKSVVDQIRAGTSYQDLLASVLLAGVRGIKPRPVGFKFHAVLVVNSAHLASIASSDRERWLPLLWAVDNFKNSQAANEKEGGWVLPPAEEGKIPAAHAKARFIEAMDRWDETGADNAAAQLARTEGAGEVLEIFLRYGARDFRDIGHKAIFVANSWRTLQTIGWRHCEPVLRSLAFALLEHEGGNPAQRDADQDRPWRENLKRTANIRHDWQRGKIDGKATQDLLAAIRTGTPAECSELVVKLLNQEIDPASVWDGLFLGAGELLMRQPGIVGLHCVTTANALHFGYQASGNNETRQMLMLQAAAFLPMFRKAMESRGKVGDGKIDTLESAASKSGATEAIGEIMADVSKDRTLAAKKTLDYLGRQPAAAPELIAAARRLIFQKGSDSHDYKFSSAALEDYFHVTKNWRARYLATSMFNLKGANDRDNELMRKARATMA
jgi:hypothetical protein